MIRNRVRHSTSRRNPRSRRVHRPKWSGRLVAVAATLVLFVGFATPASAQGAEGLVTAGCQGYGGGPDGAPLGPLTNVPDVTVTITVPDSAAPGEAFDVAVDLAGWMNAAFPVAAEDNELLVTLALTGAEQAEVEAVGGPPGVSAAPNEEFEVPTATGSITPAGTEPVTVTLTSWATNNFGAGVYVECLLESGSVVAEVPVAEAQASEETAGDDSEELAVTGIESNALLIVGLTLLAAGLLLIGGRRLIDADRSSDTNTL